MSLDKSHIAILYCLFAAIATCCNILAQELTVQCYQGRGHIILSILVGTAIGLLSKYVLDKKYIFNYPTKNIGEDSKLFFLYSAMGIITTLIFWGFEYAFELIFDHKLMRYLGACIGLAIGYLIKYRLDKKYVFKQIYST